MDIAKLDRFMQARPAQEEGVRWLAPFEPPLVLEGFAFFEQDGAYRRLPLDSDAVFSRAGRAALTELGTNTAGGCIRFRSSTGRVLVRARLAAACAMHHMPSTGQGGFDCYLRRPGGAWRYAGPSVFGHGETAYTAALWSGGDREEKEFLIHFPLYMGVKEVWVGVDADASVAAPAPRAVSGAAAVYGTSIDQGGCASHPGMAFPAILARALDVQIYNFGFSGNACLEPEMADVLARVPGLRLLVVDAEANAGPLGCLGRLPVFLARLRAACPRLPILVVSAPLGPLEAQQPGRVAQRTPGGRRSVTLWSRHARAAMHISLSWTAARSGRTAVKNILWTACIPRTWAFISWPKTCFPCWRVIWRKGKTPPSALPYPASMP